MNEFDEISFSHLPNNLEDLNFETKLAIIGLNSDNPTNIHEEILDKLLLHGKYVDPTIALNHLNPLKAELAKIDNDQKLKIFAYLLSKNIISKKYYETQIVRYGVLQTLCRYSIFNQLQGDQNEKLDNIAKLPLPTRLKDFLKEEDTACTNFQTDSFRP